MASTTDIEQGLTAAPKGVDGAVGVPAEFRVKDTVRVIRGNLRGLEGEIRENSDGTHTLVVSLALLGGATVFINPHDVEKLP